MKSSCVSRVGASGSWRRRFLAASAAAGLLVTCATSPYASASSTGSPFTKAKQASCLSPTEGRRVALDTEGNKVVASGSGEDFVVRRYLPDGSLDVGFGIAGVATVSWGHASVPGQPEELPQGAALVYAVLIQPDGKILVGGSIGGGGEAEQGPPITSPRLARLNPDGSLDQSFSSEHGQPGKVSLNHRPWQSFLAIALQGKRILLGGKGGFVARLTPDGKLDRAFAKGHGSLNVPPNPQNQTGGPHALKRNARVTALFVAPSGRICASGAAGAKERRMNVRLYANGTFDLGFGERGIRWGRPQR